MDEINVAAIAVYLDDALTKETKDYLLHLLADAMEYCERGPEGYIKYKAPVWRLQEIEALLRG